MTNLIATLGYGGSSYDKFADIEWTKNKHSILFDVNYVSVDFIINIHNKQFNINSHEILFNTSYYSREFDITTHEIQFDISCKG